MKVRSRRVVLPEGTRPATIWIDDGIIAGIGEHDDPATAGLVDFGDLVIAPGLVDTHVHVNEPGRTDWEGFDTATRAAAAGGVTTIVDMPLNSIPATTTVDALERKRRAARGKCHVDVGFWGGVVPGNDDELVGLIDAGVRGFKCFLAPSGVDEFPAVDEADLRRAMARLAEAEGVRRPLLVHAEDPAHLRAPAGEAAAYGTFLASRPPDAEVSAIRLMARLAAEYGVFTHIVHVSSAEGAAEISRARAAGTPIGGETCPHYLTFAADDVPDGATQFKCAPPIRARSHREALWQALEGGPAAALQLVASDHSPAPPAMKTPGNFVSAWGGISSLELGLAAVWTGAHARGGSLAHVAGWMSEAPAKLAHLHARKGAIRVGLDADLVVWNPDADRTVDASLLQQRHKITPYAGRRLRGRVVATFVRGHRVWDDERLVGQGLGQLL